MTTRMTAVLTGQVFSWLGDAFQVVALPVAIVVAGGSAGQMAAAITATTVARLVFTLFGGVWADRVQPRIVMAASDAVRAACGLVLACCFWAGAWSTPVIVGCAFVTAAAGAFFGPAFMTWRRAVVPAGARRRTNGTITSLRQLMLMLGPVLGGAVVGFAGAGVGFAVNAATFVASLAAVLVWAGQVDTTVSEFTEAGEGTEVDESFGEQLVAGWRAVRSRSWLLFGLLAAGFYHIGNGAILVLAPLLVARETGGAHAVGIVAAAEGLGGFVGAALGSRIHLRRPLFSGWAPLLLMPLWAFSFAVFHSVWPIAVLAAVGYAGLLFYDVHWETAIQQAVPGELQGRVHSWDILMSFVALPLGSMLAAPLAQTFGARQVIAVAACFLLIASVVPLFIRSMREFTLEPSQTDQPAPSR